MREFVQRSWLLVAILVGSASHALAAPTVQVLGTTAIVPSMPVAGQNVKFSDIAYTGYNIFLWIITATAVFYLVYGGFQYITAGGDSEKASKARTSIINSIIGIIIVMASYFILNAARNVGANPLDTTLSNL